MPSWAEALPLIGLMVTAFCGLAGVVWAGNKRAGDAADATTTAVIGGVVGGALAEKGEAQNLAIAIDALSDETRLLRAAAERERQGIRDNQREMVDLLRAILARLTMDAEIDRDRAFRR